MSILNNTCSILMSCRRKPTKTKSSSFSALLMFLLCRLCCKTFPWLSLSSQRQSYYDRHQSVNRPPFPHKMHSKLLYLSAQVVAMFCRNSFFFGCEGKLTLAKEQNIKQQWALFVVSGQEEHDSSVVICSWHFTDVTDVFTTCPILLTFLLKTSSMCMSTSVALSV